MTGMGGRLPETGNPAETRGTAADGAEAILSDDKVAQSPSKVIRRQEIERLLDNQSKDALTDKDKREMGKWLNGHFSRLRDAHWSGGDAISQTDVIETYSQARWQDKSKFLWSDMRMLQRVAKHFDALSLGGRDAHTVEQEDVDTLVKLGTVKRTETDVTATFPDGSLTRRTERGDLLKKGADGALSYKAATVQLELAGNGEGYLRYKIPTTMLNPDPNIEIKLKKGANGVWSGKSSDGDDVELSIDDHSVRMRTPDLDMLLTSNGGYIRDPGDADSAMFINTDGSITMSENGKIATIATNSENGIIMAKERDGTFIIKYPFQVQYWKNADGSAGIQGADKLPSVNVKADGTMTVKDESGEKDAPVKVLPDGTRQADLGHGMTVSYNKAGKFTYVIPTNPDDAGEHISIEIDPDGIFRVIAPDGSTTELKPPEIKY